jgi:hypothetical protein
MALFLGEGEEVGGGGALALFSLSLCFFLCLFHLWRPGGLRKE